MKIYCCECKCTVSANLISGKEVYPHREDLYSLPFWECPNCKRFVGCHHKTKDRTKPLGCIPNDFIKQTRKEIHQLIDPIWRYGEASRKDIYKQMSEILGFEFHSAEISSNDAALKAYDAAMQINLDYAM